MRRAVLAALVIALAGCWKPTAHFDRFADSVVSLPSACPACPPCAARPSLVIPPAR